MVVGYGYAWLVGCHLGYGFARYVWVVWFLISLRLLCDLFGFGLCGFRLLCFDFFWFGRIAGGVAVWIVFLGFAFGLRCGFMFADFGCFRLYFSFCLLGTGLLDSACLVGFGGLLWCCGFGCCW